MDRLPYDTVKADREREAAAKAERDRREHEASEAGLQAQARKIADDMDVWAGHDPPVDEIAEILAKIEGDEGDGGEES